MPPVLRRLKGLKSSEAIKNASKHLSKKLKGSSNRERVRKNLARKYEAVSNLRRDRFWKLAHELTNKFDVLCFETLNLKGMQLLWGRKISDFAFGECRQILEWVAKKKRKFPSLVGNKVNNLTNAGVIDFILNQSNDFQQRLFPQQYTGQVFQSLKFTELTLNFTDI